MDYAAARSLLARLPSIEVKPGLERTRLLLETLGHPERGYPAIHVAGTNGKGSVVAILASILNAAGYRVGRFTSPDLIDLRDRIAIDGEWIEEERFAALTERIAPPLGSGADRPTLFEALTAIALAHFAEEEVDIAVVEVGLGGRFDATNVVDPILTILTNVDLDHTGILGDTIAKIAWEKAGIAKPAVPLLVGRLDEEGWAVVRAEAELVGAPIAHTNRILIEREAPESERAVYRIDRPRFPKRIRLPLIAPYQEDNLRTALRAVELLRERGFPIDSEAIEEGIATVSWPGRFEVIRRDPLVVLDGAHNVAGALALADAVEALLPERSRRRLLLGILSDKDVPGIVGALVPLFSRVYVAGSSSPRSLPPEELARHVAGFPIPHECYNSIEEGLEAALGSMKPEDSLVVAGSLTVVKEARRHLEGR